MAVNSYKLLTIFFFLQLLIGAVLTLTNDVDKGKENTQSQIANILKTASEIDKSKEDTSKFETSYNPDLRAGNEFTMSFNLWDFFTYSFASFLILPTTNIQWLFYVPASILNALFIAYASYTIFLVFKNRKVD